MLRYRSLFMMVIGWSLLLAGCVTEKGVILEAGNRFALERQQVATYPGKLTLRMDIVNEALRYCAMAGKTLNIVESIEWPARHIVDSYRWARIEFECVPLSTPRTPRVAMTMNAGQG